jgi:hypothetical protein
MAEGQQVVGGKLSAHKVVAIDEGNTGVVGSRKEKHDREIPLDEGKESGIALISKHQDPIDTAIGERIGFDQGIVCRFCVQENIQSMLDTFLTDPMHGFIPESGVDGKVVSVLEYDGDRIGTLSGKHSCHAVRPIV